MKAWTQLLEPGPALATICLVLVVSSQAYSAPTSPDEHAEQSTEIEYYPVADATGCYYNFQHYDEGDRIITNEPCLNCTCHNRMLMCYLRVCPFTKAIGANCKVEKKSDQCCPVITCPEVPVQLVTSTAPSTALGHLNEYGCSIDGLFYSDGARVPSNPENPCELCYCIRNKTACVMQECTLNVEGCSPVFQEGVCCPVRYNCEHPDYLEGPVTPQISTTTTTTTTVAPTTTLQSVECFFNGQSYNDGELVKKDIPCEKCYCLRGDIVCAVQECGPTPLDKVNCTALPVQEGQCCPETYDCAGIIEEELTTISSVSYEPEVTTSSRVDQEITQGPLTTASQEEIEERKKLEGETEGTEAPEMFTKPATTILQPEKTVTEGPQPEQAGDKTEKETHAPEIIEEGTRQPVAAPKPDEHATEKPLEQTTRPALEEISLLHNITEGTEKPETEAVTRVGVETETTEKERVTIVTAITPEDTTSVQEKPRKPSTEEEIAKPPVEEETAKPSVEKETVKPSVEKETAKPHVEQETAKPSIEEETAEHTSEEGTAKPHVEDETEKPHIEEETTKPSVEKETAKPHVEDETAKPSVEEETAKPPVEEETAKPYVEEETTKSLDEEKTAKPQVDEKTAKPLVEIETVKPYVEEETSKPATAEETAKPYVEEETVRPSVEEETVKPYVEEETSKPTTAEETAKPYVEEETVRPSVEEETVKPYVEEETSKPTTAEETAKPHMEEETAKPSVQEETVKPYVEEKTSKPTTAEETVKPHVEEETVKPSVEEVTGKPYEEDETSKATTEEETAKPHVEEETVKPLVEEETVKPYVGEETSKATTEEETAKPHMEEETVKLPVEEETAKPHVQEETPKPEDEETAIPTESPIESFTSRVSEAIESITSRVTEAVEAITTAITGVRSEGPVTEIPKEEEIATEQPKEGGEPSKEGVTEQPKESEEEAKKPEEEPVTRVIAITEKVPAFPTHPSATEVPEVESDKTGATGIVSEKEQPDVATESSEKEKPYTSAPALPEKEQPETPEVTEESIKGPVTDIIVPAEKQATTLSSEKAQPEQEPVAHDDHEGSEEEEGPKVSVTETEEPSVTEESATPKQQQELTTEPQPYKETPESSTEILEKAVTHPSVTEPTQAPEKEPGKVIEPEVTTESFTEIPEEEHEKITEKVAPTEPSGGETTEPTVETKLDKEQKPITEETIVPQDCGEQGCVKIPGEHPRTTEQPHKEEVGQGTEHPEEPAKEKQASTPSEAAPQQPTVEETTPFAELKPETDKILPSEKEPEVTEPSKQITTEKEEIVIVTEIPTKKTELPESMDHVSETAYPTEAPKEGEKTEKVELEPSTIHPEIPGEPGQEPTKQPAYSESPGKEKETQRPEISSSTEKAEATEASSEGQTEQPFKETGTTATPTKEEAKEPASATEAVERTQTEQPLEESKATEIPSKVGTSTSEVSKEKETQQEYEGAVTQPITKESSEDAERSSTEIPEPTTEVPREEENEIEQEKPIPTVPKTEEKTPESEETKAPEEQLTTETSLPQEGVKDVTIHKKTEIEEPITEKTIIPEVCTSESECAPGAVPSLPEAETESTKIPEISTSQVSAKPEEQETGKPEGTTESNKIPETEDHTEETNEIPEGGTEAIPKVTGVPDGMLSHTEESSGEKPKEGATKEEEGSGHEEPEEGSGFTDAAQEGTEVTETIPKFTVTKGPEKYPEITTHAQEEDKEQNTEGPATTQPQESFTEEKLPEQPKTEHVPEIKPTEYPESTEYPERTELPEREIPGEGSCLVDGQTYKNNSNVPPINHCQTFCKCVSSILRCESIECTPPPAGMQNCMPIFISHDSCCPTYSCTGPETTSPMESDSHVIQTTTPPAGEPATVKTEQEEKEQPEVPVATVAPEEKVQEPESTEKTSEAKPGIAEGVATEKITKATELPVPQSTQLQGVVTEEPIVTKHCDEFGCKPVSIQPEERPSEPQPTEQIPEEEHEEAPTSTESSLVVTSPQETKEPQSITKVSKEPQPEEGVTPSKPEEGKVTEGKLPHVEEYLTTVEPVIKIQPEEQTAVPETTSQSSEEPKPSDRITVLPEEVTQVPTEIIGEHPTKEAETEKPRETKPTELTTEKPEQPEQETAKPEIEHPEKPEGVTEKYDEGVPTEIAQTPVVPVEEEEKEKPVEVTETVTTEQSRKTEQPGSIETVGVPYSGLPEVSTDSETKFTEGPEVVTKKQDEHKLPEEQITEHPEEEKPPYTGTTEEPSAVTVTEAQPKLPAEESIEPEKPEIIEPETTALPEKELMPEVTTESDKLEKATSPSGEGNETKITEPPKKPIQFEEQTEQMSKGTEQPEIPEPGITEVLTLTSEVPHPSEVPVTEKEQEGQVITKESTEVPVTEHKEPDKELEENQPETTPVISTEEETPEHITMPPESDSTGKLVESESHVTGQEPIGTTPKAIKEKYTEKSVEGELQKTTQVPIEEGTIVTKLPSDISRPHQAGKPEIATPAETEETKGKPTPTEERTPATTEIGEHVTVSAQEIAVTEGLLEEGTKKPEKETPGATEEIPVGPSVTEQSSIKTSEAEKTPYEVTTLPAVDVTSPSQTQKAPKGPSDEVTEVPIALTEQAEPIGTEIAEKEPLGTEKVPEEITEKITEIPSVHRTSPIFETDGSSSSEGPSVTEIPEEPGTSRPEAGIEEPSIIDNEIPGVVPEKESTSVPEQQPEGTEQPQKEAEKPVTTDDKTTKEVEKEIEITTLPPHEGLTQIAELAPEKGTTPSLIMVPEEEHASKQPSAAESTTLQPGKEAPLPGETEKPSISEEGEIPAPVEVPKEEKPEPQPEKETPVGTEKPIISKEGETSTSEPLTEGEKEVPTVTEQEVPTVTEQEVPTVTEPEIPTVTEQESKIPATEQPIAGQTEESKTLTSELPVGETKRPGVLEEETKTSVPEQPATEATKPGVSDSTPEQPATETEKPGIPEEEAKTPTPEQPIVSPEEEVITRKPLEGSPVYISPEVTTQIAEEKENASVPERGVLFTSGPEVETSTKRHIPGELSTSAPLSELAITTILPATTTILPATTTSSTESSPAHIPGEQVPEVPDYEQPGEEYEDEDQNAFGPGTCRYGGKVYVSAQQIPRDDPCDFCFCFRSDIICLQQSCPPPIPRCHEEPIRGFCCPRYECPVSMATAVNVTTSTTTTTTTLPPHFLAHAYKGRASKTGCQISGKAYQVGEPIRATSGPCLHCKCGGDGQMKCDPKPCSPEPMLRQMIAAAASRRRR